MLKDELRRIEEEDRYASVLSCRSKPLCSPAPLSADTKSCSPSTRPLIASRRYQHPYRRLARRIAEMPDRGFLMRRTVTAATLRLQTDGKRLPPSPLMCSDLHPRTTGHPPAPSIRAHLQTMLIPRDRYIERPCLRLRGVHWSTPSPRTQLRTKNVSGRLHRKRRHRTSCHHKNRCTTTWSLICECHGVCEQAFR
jgi:hypothetical protein